MKDILLSVLSAFCNNQLYQRDRRISFIRNNAEILITNGRHICIYCFIKLSRISMIWSRKLYRGFKGGRKKSFHKHHLTILHFIVPGSLEKDEIARENLMKNRR